MAEAGTASTGPDSSPGAAGLGTRRVGRGSGGGNRPDGGRGRTRRAGRRGAVVFGRWDCTAPADRERHEQPHHEEHGAASRTDPTGISVVPTADGMAGRGVTAMVVVVSVGSPGTAPATVVFVVADAGAVVDVVGVVVDVLVVVEVLVVLDEVVVDDSAGSTGA